MDHATRLALAHRVTDFVLRRHSDVLAVAVHGSTAKGEDREWSDLEMFAITRGKPDIWGYGTVHEGVVVEIALVSEEDAWRQADHVTSSWPIVADGWLHTVPMHDPDGLLARLAVHWANPDPDRLAVAARGALLGMYEDLCKMRNFAMSGEREMVRFMAPNFALYGPARFLALLNDQYYNGIRNLLTKPREFSRLTPNFWEDYPRLVTADDTPDGLLSRAERMFRECRDLFVAAGREWRDDLPLEDALERGRFPP